MHAHGDEPRAKPNPARTRMEHPFPPDHELFRRFGVFLLYPLIVVLAQVDHRLLSQVGEESVMHVDVE